MRLLLPVVLLLCLAPGQAKSEWRDFDCAEVPMRVYLDVRSAICKHNDAGDATPRGRRRWGGYIAVIDAEQGRVGVRLTHQYAAPKTYLDFRMVQSYIKRQLKGKSITIADFGGTFEALTKTAPVTALIFELSLKSGQPLKCLGFSDYRDPAGAGYRKHVGGIICADHRTSRATLEEHLSHVEFD